MKRRSNRWVAILSDFSLYNELLSYVFAREMGVETTIESQLPDFEERASEAQGVTLLCFADATNGSIQRITNMCKTWNRAGLVTCTVALYNLTHDDIAERTAIAHGVRGFFYTEDSLQTVLKGVNKLFAGEIWVPRELLFEVAQSRSGNGLPTNGSSYNLTDREMQVLAHVCTGLSNEEIADNLHVSPHTVKTHLYRIFKKIRVSNRFQASLWAAKHL